MECRCLPSLLWILFLQHGEQKLPSAFLCQWVQVYHCSKDKTGEKWRIIHCCYMGTKTFISGIHKTMTEKRDWQSRAHGRPPVLVNEVFTEYSQHLFVYVLSMVAFQLQWQSWIAVTETIWSTKPKIITTWPFKKKLVDPDKKEALQSPWKAVVPR